MPTPPSTVWTPGTDRSQSVADRGSIPSHSILLPTIAAPPIRRQVAVVAVAALALLSGCSAFGGGTPTPALSPAGYDESGITNATAARDGHLEGLLATANFTLWYNATIRAPDGVSRVTLLQTVSPGEPRAVTDTFVTASGSRGSAGVRRTRFYANGTQFVRVQRSGNTSFGSIDGTLPTAAFAVVRRRALRRLDAVARTAHTGRAASGGCRPEP